MAGEPCKPESSDSSLLSISCVKSTNPHRQRSQFRRGKQVLWHSYVTVEREPTARCKPMTARIAIHGEGIAAFCCATLLREQRATLIPADTSTPRLPAGFVVTG